MHETLKPSEYIPGSCNIGPAEVNKRLRTGYLGLAMMAIFIILDINFHFPQVWKLALFAPTVYAFSGFLQARQRFCFLFGFLGLFSMAGKRSSVKDDQQKNKDRAKALWLVAQVFFGSVMVTLLYYVLTMD